MRFVSAQVEALLAGDLWLRNAQHSNRMAKLLEERLTKIPGLTIAYPVEANGVFACIPPRAIPKILERYFFYVWNEEQGMARWMCSWDTTEEDVAQFAEFVAESGKAASQG
jgi:threonine aldolase